MPRPKDLKDFKDFKVIKIPYLKNFSADLLDIASPM